MRTPINKESFEDSFIKKDRIYIEDINNGFFLFTNKKYDGILRHIGIIRCEKAYKLYYRSRLRFLVDFYFEDYLPVLL